MELAVDISDTRQLHLLSEAMRYADADSFIEKPMSRSDEAHNKIIIVKSVSYFKRKMMQYSDAHISHIKAILDYEYYTINRLKAEL